MQIRDSEMECKQKLKININIASLTFKKDFQWLIWMNQIMVAGSDLEAHKKLGKLGGHKKSEIILDILTVS